MAYRIHVVGAYGINEDELRILLDRLGDNNNGSRQFRIGSSGKWAWGTASVWHVDRTDIDDVLSTLPCPALRVTSSDGVLWTLTLTGGNRYRFHGVHHFTRVGVKPRESASVEDLQDPDFPDDEIEVVAGINRFIPELEFLWDSEEEARVRQQITADKATNINGLEDYTDYGVGLPEAVIEEMKQNPSRAVYTAFVAHCEQIAEAIAEFGIEFDRTAMTELLTLGPLTEIESNSDIGNMPRFLQALGIDGVFSEDDLIPDQETDYEESETEEERESFDWSQYSPGQIYEKVTQLEAECRMDPIAGGPVKLANPALLHLLSHLFSENPICSVLFEFPTEQTLPLRRWESLRELEAMHDGLRWKICFETPFACYRLEEQAEMDSNELTNAIGVPPDGTRVEFLFLVEGLAEKCHRYAGTYRNQQLQLERAYPSVSADVLDNAFDLIRQIFDAKPIELASDKEIFAVRKNYQRSQGEVPRIRNRRIKPEYGGRRVVVKTLLFERFLDRGIWDIEGAQRLTEKDWEDYNQIVNADDEIEFDDESSDALATAGESEQLREAIQRMREAAEQLKNQNMVPHSSEVIYEGRTGLFLKASMSDLQHISLQEIREHNVEMNHIGFHFIADSAADSDQRQTVTRCYAGHLQATALLSHRNADNQSGWAEISHGAALVDLSQGMTEFWTDFEDRSTLVTSSVDIVAPKPEIGIYVRSYEELPVAELWKKHLDGIRRFVEYRKTRPIDHTQFNDPVRFHTRMDELLWRYKNAR